jgi:hypothetical protein
MDKGHILVVIIAVKTITGIYIKTDEYCQLSYALDSGI